MRITLKNKINKSFKEKWIEYFNISRVGSALMTRHLTATRIVFILNMMVYELQGLMRL